MIRSFSKTILADKLFYELSHIDIVESISQRTVEGLVITEVLLSEAPNLEVDQDIINIVNAHVPTEKKHKVDALIDNNFKHYPIHKIDFTSHLKKNVVLAKSVHKSLNGRPQKSEYLLNGEKIAKIRWEFMDAPGGLYIDKKLYLSYYSENGDDGEEFLIEHEIIDFMIPNQLEKSIKERVIARESIVGEIKAVCSGALQVVFQETLENIVIMIKPFWDATKLDRENFIELAITDWRDAISLIDTTAEYGWLDTPVDANGTTCKDYMLYRLGY